MAVAELEAFKVAVDALERVDPIELSDYETVLELQVLRTRTDAISTRAVGALDEAGGWERSGEVATLADWLTGMARIPAGDARRQVRLGRAMRSLPGMAKAWLKGSITGAHVERVASVARFENEGDLARDEKDMAHWCDEGAPYAQFSRVVGTWEAEHAPVGREALHALHVDQREVWLSGSYDGSWFGQMRLESTGGAIVKGELQRLQQEFFEADWAKAKADLGRDPMLSELGRTSAQRWADALVEMATRSASTAPGSRRPAPLFTVLVNYEQLHGAVCELAQGMAVTPGSLVPWLDQAEIERAVFTPDKRVEISERSRLFTGATRRAIEVRDRRCAHPLCEQPASQCEVDHITPFSEGGLSTQDNGRLLCGFHNRLAWRKRNERPPPGQSP